MHAHYHPTLVALSWLLVTLAAGAFVHILRLTPELAERPRLAWRLVATLIMTLGIWSMHFIGMLAMQLPVEVTFAPGLTVGSALPAALGVGGAVWLLREPGPAWRTSLAALSFGGGIGAMHYSGMAALELSPAPQYSAPFVIASLIAAVGCTGWAVQRIDLGSPKPRSPLLPALGLAAGAAAAHQVAMMAVEFDSGSVSQLTHSGIDSVWLAVLVGAATLFIVGVAVVAMTVQQHLAEQTRRRIEELQSANQQLEARALSLAEQMTRDLRANEMRHRLIMEGAGVGFWEWDLVADEIRAEGGSSDRSGFVLDSVCLPSSVWFGSVHGDDQARMWQRLDALQRGEVDTFEAEFRIRRNDDQWRWVMSRARVVERDDKDKPSRISGTQIDIDTRKRAELALEEERRLFNAGPVIVTHVLIDDDPRYTYFSSNVCDLWGYPEGFATSGVRREEIVHPEDLERKKQKYEQHIATGVTRFETELRYRMADGSYRWHALYGRFVHLGEVPEMIGYLLDIEDRKQVEGEAAAQKARLEELVSSLRESQEERTLLHQTGDMLNSATGLEEACQVVQRTASRLFPGWSGAIATAGTDGELVAGAQWGKEETLAHLLPRFPSNSCWGLRRGRSYTFLDSGRSVPCQHLAANGDPHSMLCVPMVANGEMVGSLHLVSDRPVADGPVDEWTIANTLERAERLAETLNLSLSNLRLRASLQEQAIRDGLTGLFNRRHLGERLPVEMQRSLRSGQPLALAMVDIDHFKRFNDGHGHEAGDLVLRAIAHCISDGLRGYDLACRYGGEEFCLVLPGCTVQDAVMRLEAIRAAAATLRLRHGAVELPSVTLSAGVAAAGKEDGAQLIARADAALYAAKAAGRDRVEVASGELPEAQRVGA